MPFNRPLLNDLVNRTRNDVVSRLPSQDVLRRSDAEVYSRVNAGVAHGLYGAIDWLSRQLIYDTADSDYLIRWASIWGITQNAAQKAIGSVTFTGSNGATIPINTVLSAYDGQLYQTSAAGTIASGSAVVPVIAQVAGLAGTRTSGQTFTLQSTVAGVNSSAVATAMTGGTDIETFDSLRSRLLTRIQQPPQGGDSADYLAWTMAVPGVTRAWVYPLELGAGTVTVRFMMDNTYSNGIPLSGDIAAVAAAIAPLRPVTAAVTVAAPIAAPLNFTISGLSPSNVQGNVIAELTALIAREAYPGGTLLLSHIREAVSLAAGEIDNTLTSPSANVVSSPGNIVTVGTFTWV
jgi:uncharacterized phage protein gp47/JayE